MRSAITCTPAVSYFPSPRRIEAPISVSTATSAPSATSFFAVSGTTDARFSPGTVSLGTKMRIAYFLAKRDQKSKQHMYTMTLFR